MPKRLRRASEWPRLERRLARDPGLADRWSGADLRAWREACGLSQSGLGVRSGRSRHLVMRFEGLERVPRWFVVACAGLEPGVRAEAAAERRRVRNRVNGRLARKREREEAELRELQRVRGMW